MLALRRHSSITRCTFLSSSSSSTTFTRTYPRRMADKASTRLAQIHRQMSSTPSPTTQTSEQAPPKPKPKRVDVGPPVLFSSEFAARRFHLNRPSAANALNHEMIKMIKGKIDVSLSLGGAACSFLSLELASGVVLVDSRRVYSYGVPGNKPCLRSMIMGCSCEVPRWVKLSSRPSTLLSTSNSTPAIG